MSRFCTAGWCLERARCRVLISLRRSVFFLIMDDFDFLLDLGPALEMGRGRNYDEPPVHERVISHIRHSIGGTQGGTLLNKVRQIVG